MRRRNFIPREHLGHGRVQPPFHHQLVRRSGLFQMGKVRPLHAFLVHPQIARIHRQVIARGAGTDHHHAALFADKNRGRKGCLAGVFKHHVDIHALAGDVPDRLAELAHLAEPFLILWRVHNRHLAPAIEILAVQNTFGAQTHHEIALVLVGNHANRVAARRVDQLDRKGPQTTGRAPDQNILPRLEFMRVMAKQHPVSGGQCQRVAGTLLPRQVLWPWHQLLRLNPRKLRE